MARGGVGVLLLSQEGRLVEVQLPGDLPWGVPSGEEFAPTTLLGGITSFLGTQAEPVWISLQCVSGPGAPSPVLRILGRGLLCLCSYLAPPVLCPQGEISALFVPFGPLAKVPTGFSLLPASWEAG